MSDARDPLQDAIRDLEWVKQWRADILKRHHEECVELVAALREAREHIKHTASCGSNNVNDICSCGAEHAKMKAGVALKRVKEES